MPTPAGGWTLGALRALASSDLVGDVPDDYVVHFSPHFSPHEIRLVQPHEPSITRETPIEAMDFTVRTYNLLKREGINTVGHLTALTLDAILGFRNANTKTADECREKLAAAGFTIT